MSMVFARYIVRVHNKETQIHIWKFMKWTPFPLSLYMYIYRERWIYWYKLLQEIFLNRLNFFIHSLMITVSRYFRLILIHSGLFIENDISVVISRTQIFDHPLRTDVYITHHSWAHGPVTRYVKLRVAHAPGMSGTFSPPPNSKETAVTDPGKHHGTCRDACRDR